MPTRRTLAKGQAITFKGVVVVDDKHTTAKPDWLDGVLSWKEIPLSEAIAEYSRYTNIRYQLAPQMDPAQPITGDVITSDIKAFPALLLAHGIQLTERRPGWCIVSPEN